MLTHSLDTFHRAGAAVPVVVTMETAVATGAIGVAGTAQADSFVSTWTSTEDLHQLCEGGGGRGRGLREGQEG